MKFNTAAIAILSTSLGLFAKAENRHRARSLTERSNNPKQTDLSTNDPYIWLEDLESESSQKWVTGQTNSTTSTILNLIQTTPPDDEWLASSMPIVGEDNPGYSRHFSVIGNNIYDVSGRSNMWQRVPVESFLDSTSTAQWEDVFNMTEINTEEGLFFTGADCILPEAPRCMLSFAGDYSDSTEIREFDVETKSFVDGGFVLPRGKHLITWKDKDTLFVSSPTIPSFRTKGGYSRVLRQWKRGTPLESASIVFQGNEDDFAVAGASFFSAEDATPARFLMGHMVIWTGGDWAVDGQFYNAGSLLAIQFESFLKGDRTFEVLFQPDPEVALDKLSEHGGDDCLVYTTLDNVINRMYRVTVDVAGRWKQIEIQLPGQGAADVVGHSGQATFFTYSNFLTPQGLFVADNDGRTRELGSNAPSFNAAGAKVEQYFAVSKDGTNIPYFIIKPANYEANGDNPTLLTAYGGFGISTKNEYDGSLGTFWTSRGGVVVHANIRGGGEFGPEWHQAAVKENRQNQFDDLISVAEDLIARKVTSPHRLGLQGGSQGGTLVAATVLQRPDLFGAVACHVPLLDMKRYNKLTIGSIWEEEYGNPDTDDWKRFMSSWSPYHNVFPNKKYPPILFQTSTDDETCHPGHTRKMVAKMQAMGHPAYFLEGSVGGHSSSMFLGQSQSFLWQTLNKQEFEEEDSTTLVTAAAKQLLRGKSALVSPHHEKPTKGTSSSKAEIDWAKALDNLSNRLQQSSRSSRQMDKKVLPVA
ncbi:Uncharacterized peptidase RP174 [Seminavis robusta]|uniref:Prolyl endopeptidase n=1 Tax=Seminavis robusta TaxID=568900 RepID=A0A9N8HUS2_9STRA|nr:Uncharacterized peptidase RP174 [Seminavis robusta]|eukprot:Sro2149_g316620.1 Uncharacterized peptidase RP174 (754) ;mRNA; r:8927-11295